MSDAIRPSTLKRATRSAALSGAALATAGALALAPVSQAVSAQAASTVPAVSTANYALTASYNPVDAWQAVFSQAGTNLNVLGDFLRLGPFDLGQTIAANQLDHLAMLPDVLGIASSMWDNLSAGVSAPFAEDTSTLPFRHAFAYNALLGGFADPPLVDWQKTLLALTTTSTTGVLLGAVGPVVGPVVSLVDSLGESVNQIGSGDIGPALETLVDIPANMTGAFLNGGPSINITPLLDLLGIRVNPKLGTPQIRLVFGGALSTGTSMFAAFTGTDPLAMTGNGSGALMSLMHLTQQVTQAIGGERHVLPPVVATGEFTTPLPTLPSASPLTAAHTTSRANVLAGLTDDSTSLKALRTTTADLGLGSVSRQLARTNRSLTTTQGNVRLATAKLKTGDIAGAAKQVGDNLAQRGERMKQNVDRGLVKAGIKKEKSTPTK